jgi:hypothetical protein
MKRWGLMFGMSLAMIVTQGCSPVESVADAPTVNKALSTLVPEYTELSRVRLPNGRRYVSLGDTEEKAISIFPKPSRGFQLDDTIPGLPTDFKSKGWETGSEGFGVILHDDKVVLAMRQFESVEPDEFAELQKGVKEINGLERFQLVTQDKAEYWFSKMGRDVLVISRVAGVKKRYQVTITIGNEHVLDSLGILRDVKKDDSQLNPEKHAI